MRRDKVQANRDAQRLRMESRPRRDWLALAPGAAEALQSGNVDDTFSHQRGFGHDDGQQVSAEVEAKFGIGRFVIVSLLITQLSLYHSFACACGPGQG